MMVVALLLIVVALQDHRAAVEGVNLDMAEDSVDDQFDGCSAEMGKLVLDTYLKEEFNKSRNYSIAWLEASKIYKELGLIAIHVYTNNGLKVFRNLNTDARNGKSNYKTLKYNWYSLHFFLTKGLQKLKGGCHNTYRGTTMDVNVVKGREVRFGSFTSSSLDKKAIEAYGGKTCFEIHTCEGAHIEKYSKYPEEREVLIPPYEKFKVKDIKKRKDKELWCETVISLESSGKRSDLNCHIVKMKKDSEEKATL
ncbi:erythroblast NAD(P)(+)--arginine ADP-ribosyltransferase-like [Danio rerio]|uniref:Erythroblast NAD(P)(+)--arginine ADP-ribosyltransferase-like n=1 Tax=Danio rerio TaxID=7955 RepID=A0AC58J4J7_DANRE